MDMQQSVSSIKGIGPKKAAALSKLNIETIEDMVYFFPRDYQDRRNRKKIAELREDEVAVVKGRIRRIFSDGYRKGNKQLLKLLVTDETGVLEVVFFNAKYLMKNFREGCEYVFYGKVAVNFDKVQMIHPDYSTNDDETGILSIYPLTKGISQKDMRTWQKNIISAYQNAEDFISQETIESNRLCSLEYALQNVHFPQEKQKLLEAKYRLIFDELFILQTGLFAARQNIKDGKNGIAFDKSVSVKAYIDDMPYPLTGAQARCVDEIVTDLESTKVMNRLVQGDVGSGKTAVAEIAMYKAVKCGYQAVLMAPTEILAKQHYEGLKRNFARHDIEVGFLSGNMKVAEKRETLKRLKEGQIQILIGTHAIIQPQVEFNKLGLVITDEQHRFGVGQRIKLKEKGLNPNILVMTATPIPRTLAVIIYGDLDISIIDELPPGRQKIQTRSINGQKRMQCYDFVEQQLKEGRQAYVVTPLIEDSEVLDVRSAQSVAEELKGRFAGYSVELIHGAMKQVQKDEIMERFYNGEIDVLVATVVIEVGINVPNSTVIVVENAERFGLAQLHQLRGRVGRGSHKSYCFLIYEGGSDIAVKRGEIMEASSDGFFIAEEDLKLRGPGEIFGMRQHGMPDLNIADLAKHIKVMEHAKVEARKVIEKDPYLIDEKNQVLRRRVIKLFGQDFSFIL